MTNLQLIQIERALSGAKGECVLATLVHVSGSSFRRAGARMLIQPDRTAVGGITAGCLEEDIRQCAFEWTVKGSCVKEFHLGTASDDLMGWGSGCKGTLRVLCQHLSPRDSIIHSLKCALARRQSCQSALVVHVDSTLNLPIGTRVLMTDDAVCADEEIPWLLEALKTETRHVRDDSGARAVEYATPRGNFSVFWETIKPPIQLCIFGSGDGACALLNCARTLGWQTVLCNRRTELFNRQCGLNADRFIETFGAELPDEFPGDERSAAVVMTHRFDDDLAIVGTLLQSAVPYVGVLGGRKRNARLREELAATIAPERLAKLTAPIGVDIGAEEPVELALSIAGEILAFMNGRGAGHLSTLTESIHAEMMAERRVITGCPECELAFSPGV